MASRMTKAQLRDSLGDAGFKVDAKLKKSELVKLYREKILKQNVGEITLNDSLVGGFSSDEEDAAEPSLDVTHISVDTVLDTLTNDEIFYKLKELGQPVGPILNSTRDIYKRKLAKLLGQDVAETTDAFSDFDTFEASGNDTADGIIAEDVDKDDSPPVEEPENDELREKLAFSADEEDEEENSKERKSEVPAFKFGGPLFSIGGRQEVNDAMNPQKISSQLADAWTNKMDKLMKEGSGHVESSVKYHEKVEDNNGTTVRTRRAVTNKTYTSETGTTPIADGINKGFNLEKSGFVPPPPKRTKHIIVAVTGIIIFLICVFVWANMDHSAGNPEVFSNAPPAPSAGDDGIPPQVAETAAGSA